MARFAMDDIILYKNFDKDGSGSTPAPAPLPPETPEFSQNRWFDTPGEYRFTVPKTALRVRVWGGGSGSAVLVGGNDSGEYHIAGGGGGGFALKVLRGLVVGSEIVVTIGATSQAQGGDISVGQYLSEASGGTCSFGQYVSATGGMARVTRTGWSPSTGNQIVIVSAGGEGIGGDFNSVGGKGGGGNFYGGGSSPYTGIGGGGAASMFGNGGDAFAISPDASISVKGAGGGAGQGMPSRGADGYTGKGGYWYLADTGSGTEFREMPPTSGSTVLPPAAGTPVLDYIGTGGGGAYGQSGINGGGSGGGSTKGGWPGGGAGNATGGAHGLIIVEW